MVAGRREFVAGLVQDPQFGPVVMFGLGGIFTEAIGDVTFRIAPVSKSQALQMMDDLAGRKLLGPFRGEAAVDKDQLCRVLTGLSQVAIAHPEIKEIDINPLIVAADGRVTAVDALVVLDAKTDSPRTPVDEAAEIKRTARLNADLERAMHPRSVAVVGVARTQIGAYPGIFRCVRNFGFTGKLYPIHPEADDIEGIKAYPSLRALPEPADLVIFSIPAERVPEALRDCIASGSKNIHIFTSGFKESGEEEGIRLQAEIEKIAVEGGLNIIGPNCMGLHVPAARLLTWTAASPISGPVAMVSQSGGNAQDFVNLANTRYQLYFSKVISYGNALTLDSTDYLAYLAQDAQTRIIAMYLEGVKDGRKLLRQITEINRVKPVVMIKGGLTESGARTVASHTGSMAGGEKIWKAFFRQTGAVPAETLEEMADVVSALHRLPPCQGRGVAILGTGGGIGVAAADSCAKAGLEMPALSTEAMRKLRAYIPPAGNMIRNPVDAHIVLMKLELMGPTLQLLAAEPYLNMFVISLHLDWIYGLEEGKHIDRIGRFIADAARQHTLGKPLVVVWRQYQPNAGIKEARLRLEKILLDGGVPVYEGLDRAVRALAKVSDYYAFQQAAAKQTGAD
jgi:acyl-CoA synthetase (NDP forming)